MVVNVLTNMKVFYLKMKITWKRTYPQAVQGVNEVFFVHWNRFHIRFQLIYTLDGLRVSQFSANLHFWVNYCF